MLGKRISNRSLERNFAFDCQTKANTTERVFREREETRENLDLTRLLERSFEKWILIENQSGIYLECCIMGKRVGR